MKRAKRETGRLDGWAAAGFGDRVPSPARAAAVAAASAVLTAAGCVYGFSGGGGLPSHVETVAVPPVENETAQFALTNEFTRQLTEAVRGRLGARLAAEDQADAIVRATITGYDDQALNFEAEEGRTPQVFQRRVTVRASVEIYDRVREQVIWGSASVSGSGEYAPESETEDVGRRLALENLVQKVVNGAQSQW